LIKEGIEVFLVAAVTEKNVSENVFFQQQTENVHSKKIHTSTSAILHSWIILFIVTAM